MGQDQPTPVQRLPLPRGYSASWVLCLAHCLVRSLVLKHPCFQVHKRLRVLDEPEARRKHPKQCKLLDDMKTEAMGPPPTAGRPRRR